MYSISTFQVSQRHWKAFFFVTWVYTLTSGSNRVSCYLIVGWVPYCQHLCLGFVTSVRGTKLIALIITLTGFYFLPQRWTFLAKYCSSVFLSILGALFEIRCRVGLVLIAFVSHLQSLYCLCDRK